MNYRKLKSLIMLIILQAALTISVFSPSSAVFAENTGDEATSSLASFTLERKEYTMPIDYSVLVEDGWDIAVDPDFILDSNCFTTASMIPENTDLYPINISIYNGGDDSRKVRDCKISKIFIQEDYLQFYTFELSNGLRPGDDISVVMDKMGTPDTSKEEDYQTLISYGNERHGGEISFSWNTQYEGLDSVTLEYYQWDKAESADVISDDQSNSEDQDNSEEAVPPFVGRWKDRPFGTETMTLDLLSDNSGALSFLGSTSQIEWELEKTFSFESLNLETADLNLYLNGKFMGTAHYISPPDNLSLNIDGNEFIFLVKEELTE